LLGDAPELYETVVMTATASEVAPGIHWRGTSYDIYTGRGWAISEDQPEFVRAGERLPQPEYDQSTEISQNISHASDNDAVRYSLGLPLAFNQDVETYWREPGDFVRAVGQGRDYSVLSQVTLTRPERLLQQTAGDMEEEMFSRYTSLPVSIPERVHGLAEDIARGLGPEATNFDLVKGIEQFLRQYPYSLDVSLPPQGSDPVDYFLFEEQQGYCDYYASAMVVLSRSLDLPARLVTGYLPQEPDGNGRQIIFQINAHSWAEVYFEGYGWVEFEPTAGFVQAGALPINEQPTSIEGAVDEFQPPPIPDKESPWLLLLWLLLPAAGALAIWSVQRRRRKWTGYDEVRRIYGQLLLGARRLGQDIPASQTPDEFENALLVRLDELGSQRLASRLETAQLEPNIQQLTQAYIRRQYGRDKQLDDSAAAAWRRMRFRYWLLGGVHRLSRLWPRRR
jgi:hypothetical protein